MCAGSCIIWHSLWRSIFCEEIFLFLFLLEFYIILYAFEVGEKRIYIYVSNVSNVLLYCCLREVEFLY